MRPAPLAPSHDHRDQLDLHAQPRRLQPVVRAGGSEPGRRDGRHRRRPRVRLLVRLPPPRQPEGLARMVTSPPPLHRGGLPSTIAVNAVLAVAGIYFLLPLVWVLIAATKSPGDLFASFRSEERRVGKECVSTCRSRWEPYH